MERVMESHLTNCKSIRLHGFSVNFEFLKEKIREMTLNVTLFSFVAESRTTVDKECYSVYFIHFFVSN